uniref:KilA-N domain-containing protein n=1 Tax=viral metagenome TaxID=1070528 RepID=A0A6C0C9D6_9ZZZZ
MKLTLMPQIFDKHLWQHGKNNKKNEKKTLSRRMDNDTTNNAIMSKGTIVNKKTKSPIVKKTIHTEKIKKHVVSKKSAHVSEDEYEESIENDNASTIDDMTSDSNTTSIEDETSTGNSGSYEIIQKGKKSKNSKNDTSSCEEDTIDYEDSKNSSSNNEHKLMKDDDIRHIIIKMIDSKYSYGYYGTFRVILMNDNGYINATKLCALVGKRFYDWKENKVSIELISALATETEISVIDLIRKVAGGKNVDIRGIYVHPDLIPHIASWASPNFAVKVSKIVREHFAKKAIEEKDKEIEEKNKIISSKNITIRKKDDKIDVMGKKIDLLLTYARNTTSQNDLLHIDNIELKELIGEISKDKVVKLEDPTENDAFAIIQCNNKGDGGKDFYVIRTLRKSLTGTINKYKQNNKFARVVIRINNPHGINFWKRIGKKYGQKGDKPLLKIKGNNFRLINGCSVHKMKEIVNKVHNERLKYE